MEERTLTLEQEQKIVYRAGELKTEKKLLIDSWKVAENDRIQQRTIYIRHYFPATNFKTLSDEEFAMLSEDALWLHTQMTVSRMTANMPEITK